jgi:ABC-2 type transport system ATP-binding protein
VTRSTSQDHTLHLTVVGPPAPVLAELAAAGVTRLRSHEPSLEEIFLTYYEREHPR